MIVGLSYASIRSIKFQMYATITKPMYKTYTQIMYCIIIWNRNKCRKCNEGFVHVVHCNAYKKKPVSEGGEREREGKNTSSGKWKWANLERVEYLTRYCWGIAHSRKYRRILSKILISEHALVSFRLFQIDVSTFLWRLSYFFVEMFFSLLTILCFFLIIVGFFLLLRLSYVTKGSFCQKCDKSLCPPSQLISKVK